MKAMIMAAGVGSRLEPLTVSVPKPMVPVANRPAMEHILALLRGHGIADVVANLWYLPERIEAYFGDGARFGVSLRYSREDDLRGTAGGVLAAKPLLLGDGGSGRTSSSFVLVAGDALTTVDIGRLIRFHEERGAVATIGLKPVADPSRFGVAVTASDGRILRFQEKPRREEAESNLANTMVYVLRSDIFEHIPAEGAPDFGRDVFPFLIQEKAPFYGLPVDGYWCDIGTLGQYLMAHRDVLSGAVGIGVPGRRIRPGVWVGEGASLDPSVTLRPPVLIGEGARVGRDASVGPYVAVGDRCVIGEAATISGSVIWNNTHVGRCATLVDCVVGSECYLEAGSSLGEGVVLSDECVVEEDSVIKRNVRIWPRRTVKRNVTVW